MIASGDTVLHEHDEGAAGTTSHQITMITQIHFLFANSNIYLARSVIHHAVSSDSVLLAI